MDFKAAIKKPWVKYSLIAVGVLGLVLVVRRASGGGAAVSASGIDPNAAALQSQEAQLAQGAANQASAQSYNLALDAQQSSEKYAEAKLAADTGLVGQANSIAGTLNLASIQANGQLGLAALSAQTQTDLATLASHNADVSTAATVALGNIQTNGAIQLAKIGSDTTLGTATLAAHTQEALASTAAQVLTTQSNNATTVAVTQSNNTVQTAAIQADVAKTQSNNAASTANHATNVSAGGNLISNIVGSLIHLF